MDILAADCNLIENLVNLNAKHWILFTSISLLPGNGALENEPFIHYLGRNLFVESTTRSILLHCFDYYKIGFHNMQLKLS